MNEIHLTPDEKIAKTSAEMVVAVKNLTEKTIEGTNAIKSLQETVKDKNVETLGFTGVVNNLNKNFEKLCDVEEASDTKRVTEKLDEVKSAVLATNIALKKIEKAASREYPAFPEIEIPEVDFSKTNKLLSDLMDEVKKPCNVKLTLKLA